MKINSHSKKYIVLFSISIIMISTGLIVISAPVSMNARAVLVNPRLSAALEGPSSAGPGYNTTNFLAETMTFWVAPDPAEISIPNEWKKEENWDVALIPTVLPTADCNVLLVEEIILGQNIFAVLGGGLDVSPIYGSAVGLVCKIPADIAPLTYNLAVGFKTEINPTVQQSGAIDLIPYSGSWQGDSGSAYSNIITGAPSFLLTEANCVVIPWSYDPESSSNVDYKTNNGKETDPFNFMHVTDIHYTVNSPDWQYQCDLWQADAQVLAPEFIAISGDIIEQPYEIPTDGQLAYDELSTLGLPLVFTSGNHDQKLESIFRYYFGSTYSVASFSDFTMVTFDSTLPLGSGIMNWIDSNAKNGIANGPTMLMCHYPPYGDYFTGGWEGVANILIENELTGVLVGHTHADLVMDMESVRDTVLENGDLSGLEDEMIEFDATNNYLNPVTEPLLFMTRTGAKTGSLYFDTLTPDYAGYRHFTVTNNEVSNYTYDLDDDGIRDAQYCVPNGRFSTSVTQDGSEWVWELDSSYNEDLSAARAVIEIPNPTTGMKWDLTSSNKTNGAYIRTSISNSTTTWIDARTFSVANGITTLVLEQVPEGI